MEGEGEKEGVEQRERKREPGGEERRGSPDKTLICFFPLILIPFFFLSLPEWNIPFSSRLSFILFFSFFYLPRPVSGNDIFSSNGALKISNPSA